MERSCLLYKLYNIKDVQLFKVNTVKTVYKGQSQGITKVASVDRWPLFGASETTFRCSRDELRLAFVDRKPLHAGVLMHRVDCRKPIQFIQFMLTRLYGKHNISYNVVVNTNTVNKQANAYTRTHTRTRTRTHTRAHTHIRTYTRTHDYLCFST